MGGHLQTTTDKDHTSTDTMVQRDREVKNAARREWLAQQDRKTKAKAKLNRRLATKKAEREDATGELKRQRLADNIPRTIENTREWVGGGPSAPPYRRKASQRDDDDEEEEDDEDDEESDDGFGSEGEGEGEGTSDRQQPEDKDTGDARLRPVQVKAGTENSQELVLDMAGLEDLFPAEPEYEQQQQPTEGQDPEASTSAMPQGPPPHKPILLTTSPRPHGPTYAFLNELQSLLGGKRYAQVVPRKNKRFELSRVVKWATKRGYGAIIVVGEDLHGEPATLTLSLLPYGPCAHFRLTSVALHRQISNSANPTAHAPELVLSNFSTPLGLSIGRLLQSAFPPLPQIVGRQVVAIHNQRDYIFFRRFRYMFALRETEASRAATKTQGRDEDVRTKMQEIGPRFTLKLRWLKRGSLGTGRQRGANGVTQDSDQPQAQVADDGFVTIEDADINAQGDEADLTQKDRDDEASARQEMLAELGETDEQPAIALDTTNDMQVDGGEQQDGGDDGMAEEIRKPAIKKNRNGSKRVRTTSPTSGRIIIPTFKPKEIPKAELPHHRKLKKNASILDSLAVQVGYNRGGTKKDAKEFEWDPRMQISRRKFVL